MSNIKSLIELLMAAKGSSAAMMDDPIDVRGFAAVIHHAFVTEDVLGYDSRVSVLPCGCKFLEYRLGGKGEFRVSGFEAVQVAEALDAMSWTMDAEGDGKRMASIIHVLRSVGSYLDTHRKVFGKHAEWTEENKAHADALFAEVGKLAAHASDTAKRDGGPEIDPSEVIAKYGIIDAGQETPAELVDTVADLISLKQGNGNIKGFAVAALDKDMKSKPLDLVEEDQLEGAVFAFFEDGKISPIACVRMDSSLTKLADAIDAKLVETDRYTASVTPPLTVMRRVGAVLAQGKPKDRDERMAMIRAFLAATTLEPSEMVQPHAEAPKAATVH